MAVLGEKSRLKTVSARLILVGSYWLSTESADLFLLEAVENVGRARPS